MPATHAGAAGAIACAHAAGRGPPLCAKALRFCTCSCTMRGTGQAVAPVRSQESCRIMAELPRPFGPSDPAVGRMHGVSFCAQRSEPYRSHATVWGHGGADYGRIQLRVELYYD